MTRVSGPAPVVTLVLVHVVAMALVLLGLLTARSLPVAAVDVLALAAWMTATVLGVSLAQAGKLQDEAFGNQSAVYRPRPVRAGAG